MAEKMIVMPQSWAVRAVEQFVLRRPSCDNMWLGLLKIIENDESCIVDVVSPRVAAWIYPNGECVSDRQVPPETAELMSGPAFVDKVEKLVKQSEYLALQAMAIQLKRDYDAQHQRADNAEREADALRQQVAELSQKIAVS